MRATLHNLIVASALFAGLLAPPSLDAQERAQLLSPEITFEAKEVFFREARRYLAADGSRRSSRSALKLVLEGRGFYEGGSGPFYYLGKRQADHHYTSPDGKQVAVYFYDLSGIEPRDRLRIQIREKEWITLKQTFHFEEVTWLDEEIRQRHKLPDLRDSLGPLGGDG